MRWAVELDRIDIQFEVAIMSQYSADPRSGHLEALYLIFWYLSKRPLKRLVMDPTTVRMSEDVFYNMADSDDWKEFYGDVEEEDTPHKYAKTPGVPCEGDSLR